MQSIDLVIERSSKILPSARVLQMQGLFDVSPEEQSRQKWDVKFTLPEQWNVGLIVGPSGSGKTTIAKELFGDKFAQEWTWDSDRSILDGFPKDMGIKDVVGLLSSVGFSAPPLWLRPFAVLSNGEKFRVQMARTLAEMRDIAVVDEFTSVVDRNVAQIGSAAIAKTVRKRNQQFIAVTCHYDVAEWLEPDWVYLPQSGEFISGRRERRPGITLEIKRVDKVAWNIFKKHHYLDTSIHAGAMCWVAFWKDNPVAFTSILHFPHPKVPNFKRGHRTVCLPDYQGVGIGNVLADTIASMCRGLGYRYITQTSHPAMTHTRDKSRNWAMIAEPNVTAKTMPKGIVGGKSGGLSTRMRATFEYVGKPMDKSEALLLYGKSLPK